MDSKDSKMDDSGAKYDHDVKEDFRAEEKHSDEGLTAEQKEEMARLGIPLTDEVSRFSAGAGGDAGAGGIGVGHATELAPRWTRARKLDNVPIECGGSVRQFKCIQSESGRSYCLVKTLNKAIYGKIKQAVLVEDKGGGRYVANPAALCAVKVISKEILSRGELAEDPRGEVATMQQLAAATGDLSGRQFICTVVEALEDADYYYVVMPFCDGGELFNKVQLNGTLPQTEVRMYMRQILQGSNVSAETEFEHIFVLVSAETEFEHVFVLD
jgi:hypothetical protein